MFISLFVQNFLNHIHNVLKIAKKKSHFSCYLYAEIQKVENKKKRIILASKFEK